KYFTCITANCRKSPEDKASANLAPLYHQPGKEVKPRSIPGQTQIKPESNPDQTQIKPESNLDQTQVKPRSNPGQTQVKPRSNPGQTQVKPRSNPDQTQITTIHLFFYFLFDQCITQQFTHFIFSMMSIK
uniref:Uncharacterized protein n=1 Tax=Periophthalmus magnuspinnatus TaxID=409849 RepID=A0A3B4B297_9GOBI